MGNARDALTEVDCFSLFITPEMIEIILRHTNARIAIYNERFPTKNISSVTEVEYRAFLGLWYARGYYQWNYRDYTQIWNPAISHPIFISTMSLKRFKEILQFQSFDDKSTRPGRWQYDKMACIREIFEMWNDNCSAHLIASGVVCVDECLYTCYNRCGMKTFNPLKPGK